MRGENAALGAAGLAGFLVLGEVVPRLGLVEQEYFPPVSRITEALATEIGDAAFWTALGDTLTGWALGLAIAVAAGIVVGVLLSVVPYLREATASTVEFLPPIGRTAGARLVPRPARRHQGVVVKHGNGGSMLDVRGLRKVYEGSGRRVEAVRDLTFTVEAGELVYLGERVIVLSGSPTVVQEQLKVDLPRERDQLTTRVAPRFAELRTRVYEQIQAAKRGGATAARDAAVDLRKDSPPVR
ncbi:hypothetical protein [Streptomyces sp. H-KF8]|uniref:hypothetical protein n=1 Tax=Streptomyces sp. H-KF8 TaxID=1727216 RepID=UPI000A5F2B43|nr:hypothetical protein [Streptomyces sp. H-KF8]